MMFSLASTAFTKMLLQKLMKLQGF